MSSSTIAAAAVTHTCTTANWCTSHEETHPGVLVHLSDFEAGCTGVVTGIKAYSWADGEPIGGATVLMFTPLPGTPTTPEAWQLEYLRSIAAA
ncbi:MAG: hypothetical protein JWP11_2212 [Frankiales bacterium]|nr:hypothetical protein [Frankiales bacterium]